MNRWHQILETDIKGKSFMPQWITNASELLPRIALGANASLAIWRSRRTDIPSCLCWQIWLHGFDDVFRWHRCFCKISLKFVSGGPNNNFPALVQVMDWRPPGDKRLSEPIRLSTLRPVANDLLNYSLRLDNELSALAATCSLRSVSKVQIYHLGLQNPL